MTRPEIRKPNKHQRDLLRKIILVEEALVEHLTLVIFIMDNRLICGLNSVLNQDTANTLGP